MFTVGDCRTRFRQSNNLRLAFHATLSKRVKTYWKNRMSLEDAIFD